MSSKVHIGTETLIAASDDGVRVSCGGARNETVKICFGLIGYFPDWK